MRWNGERNFYDRFLTFWTITSNLGAAAFDPLDFEGWKRTWGPSNEVDPNSGSVAWKAFPLDKDYARLTAADLQLDLTANPAVTEKARAFIAAHVEKVRPLEVASAKAWWDANVSGKDEDFKKKEDAQNKIDAALSDKPTFAKLKAIKAASDASGWPLVSIARTDSVDGAIPGQPQGGIKMAIEDAWEAAELGCDVIWAEFNNVDLDQPRAFAEGVRKYYPKQMLGFNLSPSLYWGKAKQAGTLITNQQLADLGYTLQFSTLFNFRTVGLALDKGLRKFKESGLDALADLQIQEDSAEGGAPMTKMHQKFAGMNRWLIMEQILSEK